ncbi:hypothetical protein F9K33_16050 [bacterium]|nr:MAG: hypothetical protein F9K33_16050 [bacterium]
MKQLCFAFFAAAVLQVNVFAGDGGQAGSGGYFGPAAVMKQGAFLIGAEAQNYLKGPKSFGVLGHVRYGLAPRFELNGDLGFNRGETYFGGSVEYQVFYDGPGAVGLTVRGGGFSNSDAGSGLDFSGMVGNRFSTFSLYGGLNMKVLLDPSQADNVYTLVGGVHIPFKAKVAFVGEVGANINDQDASYFSGGVLFYF